MKETTAPLFKWKELQGKTVKIIVTEDADNGVKVTTIMGHDINTSDLYLLRTIAEKVTP